MCLLIKEMHAYCKAHTHTHTHTCLASFPGQPHHQEPINPNGQISPGVPVSAAWKLQFLTGSTFFSLIQNDTGQRQLVMRVYPSYGHNKALITGNLEAFSQRGSKQFLREMCLGLVLHGHTPASADTRSRRHTKSPLVTGGETFSYIPNRYSLLAAGSSPGDDDVNGQRASRAGGVS